jgi:hypothetical protein
MYVYHIEMYTYCVYCISILCRSVCPLVVKLYMIQDEVVSPQTPRKYTVLNRNFVLFARRFSGTIPWYETRTASVVYQSVIFLPH